MSHDISNMFVFAPKAEVKEFLNFQLTTLNFFLYLCRLVKNVIDKTKFYG